MTPSGAGATKGTDGGTARACRRITVAGQVQGVGFRPFVFQLAQALGLAGFVANAAAGVVIEVEGVPEALDEFARRLQAELPPLASITRWEVVELPVQSHAVFTIRASDREGPMQSLVLPDIATCSACLAEIRDPHNRRYRYPFTNCTHCGPRYSIITAMPYDRPYTAMAGFAFCAACQREYGDPADRRFHAQPIACPDCGPR